jgi:hypothetical protein
MPDNVKRQITAIKNDCFLIAITVVYCLKNLLLFTKVRRKNTINNLINKFFDAFFINYLLLNDN